MDREMIDPSNMVEIKIELGSPKKDQTRPEFVKDKKENYYIFKRYNGSSVIVTEPGSEKLLYKSVNGVTFYVSSNNKDPNIQRNGASIEKSKPENDEIVKRINELEEQISQMKISLIEEQSKNSLLEQSLKEINKKLHKKNKKKQVNKFNDEEVKSKTSAKHTSSDIKKSYNTNKDNVCGDSDESDDHSIIQ